MANLKWTAGALLALALSAPTARATDVKVTMSIAQNQVLVGQNAVFTVIVDNTSTFGGGPLGASITLQERFPAGLQLLSIAGQIASSDCTVVPGGLDCTFPMAAGEVRTATVTFQVMTAGTHENTVTVSPDIGDPFTGNNSAAALVVGVDPPAADLAVTKRVERLGQAITEVNSGQRFQYYIRVTNVGGTTAPSATLRDVLPTEVVYELHLFSALQICSTGPNNAWVECATGPIEPGQYVELQIDVTANGAGQVANTAQLVNYSDANVENNQATATITMFGRADLSVTKTGPTQVEIGALYTYTVVVHNNGPETTAVTLTDIGSLPFSMLSATTTAGNCTLPNEFRVDCTHPGLASGAEFTVTISARADRLAPEATNSVEVSGSVDDPDSENNRASVTTAILDRQTDIAVTKTASAGRVGIGDAVTFTIVVSNVSSYRAEGVRMTDILSAEFSFASVSTTAGTCANANRTVICQLGTIAPGASVTVTLVARGASAGLTANTASVTTTTPDQSEGNNQSIVVLEVYAVGLTYRLVSIKDQTCVNGLVDLGARTTDGNRLTIAVSVTNGHPEISESVSLWFKEYHTDRLLGDGSGVVTGTVGPGQTVVFEYTWNTTGWAWNDDETAHTDPRRIFVEVHRAGGLAGTLERDVVIDPKPVILVHGLWSNAAAWAPYPGFAESLHPGYAGRVVPVGGMDTGLFVGEALLEPTATHQMFTRTTIAQNAGSLDAYIDALRTSTGACHVDIVAHSMGGLISRHWIHNSMPQNEDDGERMLRHLVQLGTPNEGSPCADDIMAMYPTILRNAGARAAAFRSTRPPNNVIELTTTHVKTRFNRQVTNYKGVPIFLGYSDKVPFTCRVWSAGDGVVEVSSALATTTGNPFFRRTARYSMLHTDMTADKPMFDGFVAGILAEPPGGGATGWRVGSPDADTPVEEPPAVVADATEDVQYFLSAQYDVLRGQAVTVDLPVSGATDFGVSYLASMDVTSRLDDPTGAQAAAVAAGTPEAALGLRAHSVAQPADGTWRLVLGQSARDTVSVLVSAWVRGSLLALAGAVESALEVNHVRIVGSLVRGTAPEPGATVTAFVVAEDGATQFPLRDDGQAGDEIAGDGRYSALFRPTASGMHLVTVDADAAGELRTTTFSHEIEGISGVGVEPEVPTSTAAGLPYPNPASAGVSLPFELERDAAVDIRLYDLLGREVLTVRTGRMPAGVHSAGFDVAAVPSGRYFLHARLGDRVVTRAVVVAR